MLGDPQSGGGKQPPGRRALDEETLQAWRDIESADPLRVTEGDVANYRDRIEWIEKSLWPAHQSLLANPGEVERLLQRDFDKQVEHYRKFTPGAIGEDVGEEVIEGLEKAGELGKHALPPVPRLP